jgi:hypothetical protein
MRFILPLLAFAIFMGLLPLAGNQAAATLPSNQVTLAAVAGETFVTYAQALGAFQRANPAFTGSATASQLNALGYQFSSSFLATVGNKITTAGTNARVITTYGTLPAGALGTIVSLTGGDATFGTSTNGTTWTSVAPGAAPAALAVTVPAGGTVSVVQIGT